MTSRFAARVATVAAAALLSLGAGSAAMASPPVGSGFMLMGYYPTEATCVSAAQANYPFHGPVYICEKGTNGLYLLWMH
ncbi:hypothetical protein ACPXCE_03680 [Streptomyces sp. DT24]|uniref:hypothetical protein n=1 Tax=unclassified Streptomyces TaxID=2593676 RepID=UPI0023BA3922|nr:hypothetical protein [Streptomyces sp. AM 4-1-1]WEH37105.1 hypothetical protein PZB75_29335 [Streptomyces sp. AM 4-1-1]